MKTDPRPLDGLNLERPVTVDQLAGIIRLAGIVDLARRGIRVDLLTASAAAALIVDLQRERTTGRRRTQADRDRTNLRRRELNAARRDELASAR